jgi:glycosyltransferase involved in cell wall biosynthesis
MVNEEKEYKRLKKLIHTAAILEEQELLDEIEEFGRLCQQKKLYKVLKYKFKWHRKVYPEHFPIGHPTNKWIEQQTPLVSVIVPNYCHEPFLRERIECILNQTFRNFELILLDDCSKDNSKDILLSYKDHPKVSHVIINNQNTGNTFLQWEKGVALAKGKYVWIAESDDYADETFLDSVMTVFNLHEDCVLVRTGSYQVNEKGRVLLRDWDVWKEDLSIYYYKGADYIRHNMLHFNYVYNASMVVFRKDIFGQIDKSYQKLRYTGDWQCWIEFMKKGPVCEYRRKLNYFRQHQNKVSTRSNTTNKGIIDQINVLAYVIDHLKLSAFRKMMIRGEQYQLSLRWFYGDYDQAVKDACFEALENNLHASQWDYFWYRIVSFFDFLPFIPSLKNDKFK